MSKVHHVIYVPGIMDDVFHVQGALVKTWFVYGVHGHIHPMPWAGQDVFSGKLQSLLNEIDRYADSGATVSLAGASAGASAIINAYVKRRAKISGLVYICGKINGPETVSDHTYARNPAFKESMYHLQKNLKSLNDADKAKMLSLYSPADRTVPYEATEIPGVEERKLPALSHSRAILYATGLAANVAVSFLKRHAAHPL